MQKQKSTQKKKSPPKLLKVIASTQITANMQCITLQGEAVAHFPKQCAGNYVKLLFTANGGTEIDFAAMNDGQRPVMRTFTIRDISHQEQTIDIDFVRHITNDLQCGFAGRWAMNTKVGDTIYIAGPGANPDIKTDVDWFFMAADMTALPALSAQILSLPEEAKGYAVIKVISKSDIQPIKVPNNLQVIWLTEQESLAQKVRGLTWLEGEVSVWVACEFDSMRSLRAYFRNDKAVERDNIYISSYWKQGVSEDGHKTIKQKDAQESEL